MDVFASTVVAIDSQGQTQRYPVPGEAATIIRHRRHSGFVIATEREVMVADDNLCSFERIAELVNDSRVRTNDGGCDPLGGFVVGTMAYDEASGCGAVHRVAPSHQVTDLLAPVSISNGVQWSSDGTRAYYIDSPTRRVDVFDVDHYAGTWSGRRTHLSLDPFHGVPDGMAIDEDGGLWIAMWGAGVVGHYDNEGDLVETVMVPGASQVSSCAFGGDRQQDLYITTSRKGLAPAQEPDAGSVFVVSTSVRGASPSEFGG